jgi:hypothetical protein
MGNNQSDDGNKIEVKINSCKGCCPFETNLDEFKQKIKVVINEYPSHITEEYHFLIVEIKGESIIDPKDVKEEIRKRI